jgi:uncharacterized membrane protein YadS
MAASFIAEHQGGPQLLYALFFGMAFNFAANGEKVKAGIEFASRQILRFGVALLGARITAEQISGLGTAPIMMVIGGVVLTILFGALVGLLLGRPKTEGLLTGAGNFRGDAEKRGKPAFHAVHRGRRHDPLDGRDDRLPGHRPRP